MSNEVINNFGAKRHLDIRDLIPEFKVEINQLDNWDVTVYYFPHDMEYHLTFRYPPTPTEILEAIQKLVKE